ncbi:MAG: tyrosine-type recombinase/integrase [Firmicutes bacterium]|nr:tyrosine-type recombinase/integrase [Bacillota bacterium]
MKDILIKAITQDLRGVLDSRQLKELKCSLENRLSGLKISECSNSNRQNKENNTQFLEMFISAKRVEGCSENTLTYYNTTIEKLLSATNKPIKIITTDDLRAYLADYQQKNNASKVTVDNVRRILSSFFSWLEDEDYIVKSPVRRIHKVKTATIVKETLTDENMEILRDTCKNIRDLAMVEMLSSTGIRVGELVNLNISDINFNERSCIVLGKGNKEREVYFDARTKLHLQEYIQQRTDNDTALFVSRKAPNTRLTIGAIQRIIKNLGIQAEINKLHPHKFRRTLATRAIDKGMPIEQVQRLLGHKKIETTMHYAMVNQSNVKMAHRKYIG